MKNVLLVLLVLVCVGLPQQSRAQSKPLTSADLPKYTAACERQLNPVACLKLAAYWQAQGDNPSALTGLAKATRYGCDGAAASADKKLGTLIADQLCRVAGDRYREGRGVPVDFAISTKAYRQGCDAGNVTSCAYYAESLKDGRGVARDQRAALAPYKKACSATMPVACYQASRMLFFQAQSDKGNVAANADYRYGRDAARIACSTDWMGRGSACWYSGIYLENGWGGAKSPNDALAAYKTACTMTEKSNFCWFYGKLLVRIDPPLRDLEEAKRVFRKSCDAGYQNSCDDLQRLN